MRKILLIVFAFISSGAYSQMYFGTSHSNYSGIEGSYLNPSSTADSRIKWGIEIYSINAFGDNNEAKFNYRDLIQDARDKDSINLGNYLTQISDNSVDLVLPFLEVRGPSFMASLNRNFSIGLITRVRLLNQLTSFEGSFFNSLAHGLANTGTSFILHDNNPYYWTSNVVTDLGINFSAVIYNKEKNFLKAGITPKLYRGNAIAHLEGTRFNGEYFIGNDSLSVGDIDFDLYTNLTNDKVNELKNFNSPGRFFDEFFGNSAGNGFGGDIGITYEYRPDPEKYFYEMNGDMHTYDRTRNKYAFKIGVSVLDVGMIKYTDVQHLHVTGNGRIPSVENFTFTNYTELQNQLAQDGFTLVNETGKSVTVNLPTRLLADVDVKITDNIYANGTYMQSFFKAEEIGNTYPTMVSMAPRYESSLFDIGIPVSYNNLSEEIKAGLGFRILFLTIGSDDLLGLLGTTSKGFNIYAGLKWNVPYCIKDKDGDKVSDDKDVCPNEKGTWEYKGCPIPDKDGDGILDNEDKCPSEAGPRSAMGCPDKDGDGITDASDECPDVAGLAQFNGCPDTDGDSIPDKADKCPNEKGEARFEGCPDSDRDGIADAQDKCPTQAGSLANEGCPDTDGDGVHDGIDKCPSKPGPATNSGCPVITTEVKKRLAFAATAIQFDFGKATIKKQSFKLLDEIVAILNEYSDYYMTIEGHTDNIGSDETNLKLSTDRAASVRTYFIGKGIKEDRLTSAGFGESKPVASNKTSAGRAKNRRVDMDLKLK